MAVTTELPISESELRFAVCEVAARHPVQRIELFGSRALGTAGPESDIDLLVKFLPGARVGLFEMGALQQDLEERLGRRVDLVSRAAVERSSNPYKRRSILSAPITLYAR